MKLSEYIEEIKLELTGGILELELPDESIGNVVKKAFREIQRYIDSTKLVTVPFASCIDLTDFKCSSITRIYRTEGYTGDSSSIDNSTVDPMYAQRWMAFSSGGTMYNLNDYMLNYMSYNTMLQLRNTTTTDLSFKEDKAAQKLYVNVGYDTPKSITIEYVPIFQDVSEITSDYWIDILQRMALAMTKIVLGRIRSRYTQSNALWTQDGDTMLNEGNAEINSIREILRTNSTLFYPID